MLDLFCGRFGWGRAFAARGWKVFGFDLVCPPEIPLGCTFQHADILNLNAADLLCYSPDFICASSPCDEFSCFSMRMFQPDPPYPHMGIRLFDHTKKLCELCGVPFVMENTRGAVEFVGRPISNCGPFYLWGSGVPPLLPQGITKSKWKPKEGRPGNFAPEWGISKRQRKAIMATIPSELASCVADYAEALCAQGK